MLYFCYQCNRTVNVASAESLRCSVCHGEFIEEINPQSSDHSSNDEDNVDPGELFRILVGVLSHGERNAPSSTASQPEPSRQQAGPSGRNFFSTFFSGIMQHNNPPSSSSNSAPRGGPSMQNRSQQSGDAMSDFLQQLIANLVANTAPGVQIQVRMGDEPIHGNFNNYILGDGAFDQFISHLLNNTEMQQRGLSDEQLAKFPEVKISEEQVKGEFQCTTCMETFIADEPVIQLPCKHVFHKDCIFPWLKKQPTCPICRKSLATDESDSKVITDIDDLD